MTARKPAPLLAPTSTMLPNSLHTLRAVFVWIDQATGYVASIDRPILGWIFNVNTPPQPIVVGGTPERTQLVAVRDDVTKTWTDPHTGDTFSEWKQVVAPLYAAYDLATARDKLEKAKQAPEPKEPITEPSIGGVGLSGSGDQGVIGQPPKPWKPGR